MSLTTVSEQLGRYASAIAAKAARANDPDSIATLRQSEAQFRALLAMAQAAELELQGYRAAKVRKPVATPRKAKMGALEFWALHGKAVAAIRASYGENWKVVAPFGETEVIDLPAGWRSCKTERGITLKWGRDHRMPAAQYWPGRALPAGLIVIPDTPRADSSANAPEHLIARWDNEKWRFNSAVRAVRRQDGSDTRSAAVEHFANMVKIRQELRELGVTRPWSWVAPKPTEHDAAWHLAHGYVMQPETGTWISGLLMESQLAHAEGIELERAHKSRLAEEREATRKLALLESAALTYGPQPLAEDEYQMAA